jgi:hypothetical protein
MISEMKEGRTACDISAAAADYETFDAPFAGYLDVSGCYIEWTEATGSQTSAQAVISLYVGGNVVGTVTASQSGAIGDVQLFTVDGTYATAANPHVEFAAGDIIKYGVTTQASGGTVTGTAIPHMCLNFGA